METKKISMGEKTFEVHELLATESDSVQSVENTTERLIKLVKMSTSMTDDEYSKLTVKERDRIMNIMSELNGWNSDSDFQNTTVEKKD